MSSTHAVVRGISEDSDEHRRSHYGYDTSASVGQVSVAYCEAEMYLFLLER
jgi:hypothetical protein